MSRRQRRRAQNAQYGSTVSTEEPGKVLDPEHALELLLQQQVGNYDGDVARAAKNAWRSRAPKRAAF